MTEIERLTAENDRLTGELARPKHETLRQLADVVERYDHMKLRAEAAEAQAAADREGTKRYADKWRAAEARVRELEGALRELVWIIDKAGLLNLSNGVQLGQTSWYVKAYDRLEAARAALAAAQSSEEPKRLPPLDHAYEAAPEGSYYGKMRLCSHKRNGIGLLCGRPASEHECG